MICTAEVDSTEDFVLGDLVYYVSYSWQWECIKESEFVDSL